MQFKLSELRLTCLQVQWWRKKSWALKWQVLTDHVSIKILQFLLYQGGKMSRSWSCLGHSLDCRVYGWKHGHFARLDRTQCRDQALSTLAFVNKEVVLLLLLSTVLWHHGCVTLHMWHQTRRKALSVSHEVWQDCLHHQKHNNNNKVIIINNNNNNNKMYIPMGFFLCSILLSTRQNSNKWRHNSIAAAYFCLEIRINEKQNKNFCLICVFGRYWI